LSSLAPAGHDRDMAYDEDLAGRIREQLRESS
jgi:hypothetical protein